jgi:hypothetical protein
VIRSATARRLTDTIVVVRPMTTAELRRAVIGPAREASIEVDDGLVPLLLADLSPGGGNGAAHDPGALPLLSHALLTTAEVTRASLHVHVSPSAGAARCKGRDNGEDGPGRPVRRPAGPAAPSCSEGRCCSRSAHAARIRGARQLAVQVSAGALMVPLAVPWRPKLVEPAAARAPL